MACDNVMLRPHWPRHTLGGAAEPLKPIWSINLQINVALHKTALDKNRLSDEAIRIRDWSLITGRGGGLQNGRGGHVKFYLYEKGGRKKF